VNLFDRFLLAVYTLFVTVIAGLFSAVMLGWPAPLFLLRDVFYPGRPEVFWPLMAVLILAGIRLFWASMSKPQKKLQHVVLSENAMGQVNVAVSAVEELVNKVTGRIHGVKEVSSQMLSSPEGVGIKIQASVSPEINVPNVSSEIQNAVREKTSEIFGLAVNNVAVHIESIAVKKQRVE
jgi:uncharacterized alkaline shock family protein YloU